jgi:SNF2 family DNA or RNA helicase
LEGFRWLHRFSQWGFGVCLADDMGLGKTVQALALLLERAKDGPALVVAPTSVAANWLEETRRFAPTLRPILFGRGAEDRQSVLASAGPFDLVIASYGLLHSEAEAFAAVPWHTAILDEAQAIKNRTTKRSQAAMNLQASFRLITTGTPVENRLGELHTLFNFINPGLLGSWEHFRSHFADPIERHNDAEARDRLRRLIRPFILRRLKSAVLRDLPPRTEIPLHVELSPEEAAFYEALRQRALENVAKAAEDSAQPGQATIRILAELTRLRRACCHPKLIDPGTDLPGSKLRVFAETLEEILAGRHKVLVFSQFVDHLAIVREHLEAENIRYQYLDGSTPPAKRQEAVRDFQAGLGDVFLISLKAGGFGLNLTAADYVIHLDPWWNPAAEDQASDRAHRIGQQRPVTIYRLIASGTVEDKIVDLHHRKRELADSLLDGTDAAGRMTPEEMLELLRG